MSKAAASLERGLRNAVEFIPDRLYYLALTAHPPAPTPQENRHFFCIDNEMVYWNFYLDFGPLNLGHVYRFCALLNKKMNDPKLRGKVLFYYSAEHPHKRTNAAFLICAWSLLCLNNSPEDAFKPFRSFHLSFPPWHDATPTVCTFNLTILDTLRGLAKAREFKFFDFEQFNAEEYEFYEQVENGDLNWPVEGRFVMFAGPHAERQASPGGYYNLRPEDYISYFKKRNVNLVVRLNKAYYDSRKFTAQGIQHMELYFLDGSNPSEKILQAFISRCEETSGAVAVHCKAGLGRTGCVIGAYIMKHYKLTAEELIGWLRIVRPGSIIGPQQQFMKEIQNKMWREGDLMRARLHQLPALGSGSGKELTAAGSGAADAATAGSPSTALSRKMNQLSVSSSSPATAGDRGSPLLPAATSSRSHSSSSGGSSLLAKSITAGAGAVPASPMGTPDSTQGDLLRLRRAQNASASSTPTTTNSGTKGSAATGSSPSAASSPHSSPSTPSGRSFGFSFSGFGSRR